MKRTVFALITGIIAILLGGTVWASEDSNDPNNLNVLGNCLRYTELHNPGLKASYQEWRAAAEEVPQAKTLPDPRFNYEVETQRSPHGQSFGISQTLPWFGTLNQREASAVAAKLAAEKRYLAQRLRLFAELKQAYYDYSYLARQVQVAKENLELLKHFEQVTSTRYATSQTTHPDHIRSQIEVANAEYEYQILERLKEPLVVRLNSILNRPSFASLPWPAKIEFKKIVLNHQEMIALVIMNNPDLQAMNFEIDVAARQVELAKKKFYPEFDIGINAMYRSDATMGPGAEPVYAMFSMSLPIWRESYKAGQRQAQAGVLKARHQKTEAQNNAVTQTESAIYDFENTAKKVELYGNVLIPRTKELLKASEAAYSSGTIDFLNLIEAQRLLLRYRLEYELSITENLRKIAELEALCGIELPVSGKQ